MNNNLLNQILDFRDNKSSYSEDEQMQIKERLSKQVKKRISSLNKIIMGSIDDINTI